jgi:hypothetical protein
VVLVIGGNPTLTSDNDEEETKTPTGFEGKDFDTPRTGVGTTDCWGTGEGSVRVGGILSVIFTGSV